MVKKKIIVPPGVKTPTISKKSNPNELPPNYKQGNKRPYLSTEITSKLINETSINKIDYIFVGLLTVLGFYTRFIGVENLNSIVFDEIHIVRHINDYLNGNFFLDITPPFGKIFYTLVAKILGYNGNATELVKAGQSYQGTDFPYVDLRIVSSVLGSGTISFAYLTLRNLGVRSIVAVFTSLLIIWENSFIVSSRFFMNESLSLLILSISVYSFTKFQITKPFSKDWARYLVLTGLALGLGISTKWIAFSTIAWVGILSLQQLWYLFGDLQVSNGQISRHIFARLTFLLASPIIIYLGVFAIHILLMNNVTRDSSLLSTHFQRSLSGNDLYDIPKYVTYGSTVTIRHLDSMGGFLHSHPYNYKTGSHNQQVTIFDYKDFNNEWIIEPHNTVVGQEKRVKNDVVIKLRHKNTGKLLRVDNFKPPMTEQDYDSEVSCFGNKTFSGNETDLFLLKVENEDPNRPFVESVNTKFRLWNQKKKCTILSHDLKLPDWGFNQQEVLCIESPNVERALFIFETIKYDKNSIDYNENPELFEKLSDIKPSFLTKFVELNTKMLRIFKSIKPHNNHNSSDAIIWPFLIRGVKYFVGDDTNVYLIGNPINWWLVIMLITSYGFVRIADLFRVDNQEDSIKYKNNANWIILGWGLHYFPYVLNEGEFFTSYYELSLYFGILLIGITFEYINFKKAKLSKILIIITLLFGYYFYSNLSPVTYGTKWDYESCINSKAVDSWGYNCDVYKTIV
ncbi:Dolichyl-phosphate-mannose-protein mannosyltransferase 1 [Wickerhamomyces ciferrii]|uniref:Dolichyl-phosphate-mannose--protein mannosyltransferase n=1 Tax=Wickerhamomyces ciferrii (strain ATCC 14091 / BCRC 22168 / CBS 111 / JCM 3599 / NBRC 0793 / NRRL Y-1031 F-60-10) TaxID=1206466 RepID=K0KZG2_WICCF|nr:Dolichyl-phosphate-mannose-protein mannosyltransferase 1 [Wickerhamomyces ciferrii]CCH46523.1 Dolichyl-phosphate-mannose-protein mannosyltransferase 1 [Wickerhamomyces ciferrii]